MDLFEYMRATNMEKESPLAARLRPTTLEEVVGQQHIIGKDKLLYRAIKADKLSSLIFYGPPGTGKTTLAKVIANTTSAEFTQINATVAGKKDMEEVIAQAKNNQGMYGKKTILFIDEIHRFNKSQQDSLLGAVESGIITLIGATTENPSFEVIRPLLSRAQVYVLKPLDDNDLHTLLDRAISTDEILRRRNVKVESTTALFRFAGGDARKLLNILDLLEQSTAAHEQMIIDDELVTKRLQENPSAFDKNGELHYDIISAFIKSIRGSDPDAAIYWLARLIAGGEDPEFIARRLVISASEDIGLANPNALLLANATFDTLKKIGWPEGRIPLAECTIYLATSPKSNSAYKAINAALELVNATGNQPVPLHLRNAPTKLMAELGYGADYKYSHDYPGNFVRQQFMPDALQGTHLWTPCNNAIEAKIYSQHYQRWYADENSDKAADTDTPAQPE